MHLTLFFFIPLCNDNCHLGSIGCLFVLIYFQIKTGLRSSFLEFITVGHLESCITLSDVEVNFVVSEFDVFNDASRRLCPFVFFQSVILVIEIQLFYATVR